MLPAGEITGCTPVGSSASFKPVERLLPHEVVVAAVFELQTDEAQREHRVGADEFQPRRARDRDLDRNGDVALDLFGDWPGIAR